MGNAQCNFCLSRDKEKNLTEEDDNRMQSLHSPKFGSPRGRSPTGSFIFQMAKESQKDNNAPTPDDASEITGISASGYESSTRKNIEPLNLEGAKLHNNHLFPPLESASDSFRASHSDFIIRVNDHFRDRYDLREQIGKGNYKEVFRVIHRSTKFQRAALRHADPKIGLELIGIMRELNHPHIIKTHEYYDEKRFYEIADHYQGGELFDYISDQGQLVEKEAATLIKQLLQAINYLHKKGIVHRNICAENIVFEDKAHQYLRLLGFSSSSHFKKNQSFNELKGVPYYIAPEVIKRNYNNACDIWSCGVLLYIMLVGFPPFPGESDHEILNNVLEGNLTFEEPEWEFISTKAKDFIRKLMEYDHTKRISAEEALKDPWLEYQTSKQGIDLSKLTPEETEMVDNIIAFHPRKKVQEIVWVFFTDTLINPSFLRPCAELFKAIDKHNDGILTRDELAEVIPAELLEDVIKCVDVNNSGTIEFNEFVMAAFSREKLITTDKINLAFKLMDKNQDGFLGVEDLREIFDGDGSKEIKEEVFRSLIHEADTDGDGQISLKEFNYVMKDIERDERFTFSK